MRTGRRSLLQFGGAILAAAAGGRIARADAGSPRPRRPRYFVQLVPFGGLDPILTTDPKKKGELDADIDLPYAARDIVTSGDLQLGPHFASLARWSSRMTVLNSVFVGTANHPAGGKQISRLRMGVNDAMPMAIEIIGSHRDGQALPCIALAMQPLVIQGISAPHSVDPTVFAAVDTASPDDLRLLADVTRRQAKGLGPAGATRDNVESCATFFERLATTPRFARDKTWSSLASKDTDAALAYDLQRTVWLLENDLTCGVLLAMGDWDTHTSNLSRQLKSSSSYLPAIGDFLTALDAKSCRHGGSLLDNTVVVIGSELGRHPILNKQAGKDHFPEMPMMFVGAVEGRGHAFGRSGRRMQSLPISKKSGRDEGGKRGIPTLNDVGATVLRLFGVNPEACGYDGDTLEFLGV